MVAGTVVRALESTVRHPELAGKTLLVVKTGEKLLIAVDTQGAGVGDQVLVGDGPNQVGYHGGIIKDVVLAILDKGA